jgi:hypothetical protein
MIRIILSVALLIIVFSMTCQAQGLYSKKNLEQTSDEDLSLYLTKAQKLKRTGGVITIAGSSTMLAGFLLMLDGETASYIGIYMSFVGLGGVTAIGLPVLATGSSRVKKISKVWNAKHKSSWIDLAPCGFYNYQTQNIQPGVSLRIRF